jgi:hypothetical protein
MVFLSSYNQKVKIIACAFPGKGGSSYGESATSEREESVRKSDIKIAWRVQLGQNVLINLAGKERRK